MSNKKEDQKDEIVDGPAVAAQILNRMNASSKERIVANIKVAQPQIAAKIENKLFNFDEILNINPQGVQTLIKSIEYRDLLYSFKTAKAEVKNYFLNNMSDRKREMVDADFKALPPVRLSEVEEAQRRIIMRLEELRISGQIRSADKQDVWV